MRGLWLIYCDIKVKYPQKVNMVSDSFRRFGVDNLICCKILCVKYMFDVEIRGI